MEGSQGHFSTPKRRFQRRQICWKNWKVSDASEGLGQPKKTLKNSLVGDKQFQVRLFSPRFGAEKTLLTLLNPRIPSLPAEMASCALRVEEAFGSFFGTLLVILLLLVILWMRNRLSALLYSSHFWCFFFPGLFHLFSTEEAMVFGSFPDFLARFRRASQGAGPKNPPKLGWMLRPFGGDPRMLGWG